MISLLSLALISEPLLWWIHSGTAIERRQHRRERLDPGNSERHTPIFTRP
jgi:hypothetical protein